LCHWVRRADSADTIAWDATQAVQVASEHPGKIATLILPGDVSWRAVTSASTPPARPATRKAPDQARIDHIARVLKSGEPAMIILANKGTRGRALELAGRVARATGARLGSQFFTARIERGVGRTPIKRIPYAVAQATAFLSDFQHLITVETVEPVAFFSYPDKPSLMKKEGTSVHALAEAEENSELAFEMLLDALGVPVDAPQLIQQKVKPHPPARSTRSPSPMRWPWRSRKTRLWSMNR
jgi:acetolactate synthase-1/2/3 large subunit